MTERERWIVYPLLFLALGAALRDKLIDRTITKSIVCQELSIVDEESTNPQSERTLIRLGRAKPLAGGKSFGFIQVNGELELVDDDQPESSPGHLLVKLGRTEPHPNVPSHGYAVVKGEVAVDGVINARQYVYQGIPFVPLQLVPGAPMPNMLQALPQQGPKAPNSRSPNKKSPTQQPAKGAKDQDAAEPSSPADDGAAPAK